MKSFIKNAAKVVGLAGITYFIVIAAYNHGYSTWEDSGGGLLRFGPSWKGGTLAVLAAGLIFTLIITFLVMTKGKNFKFLMIGYLILTIGVVCIVYLFEVVSDGMIQRYNDKKREATIAAKREANIQEQIEFIDNTIGPVIRNYYPNAEFDLGENYYSNTNTINWPITTIIKLGGYKYDTQPNIDEEIEKWTEIKKDAAIENHPYNICIDYYFDNAEDFFIRLNFRNDSLEYNDRGMTKEGLEYITNILDAYLSGYHSDYQLNFDNDIRVVVYDARTSTEEPTESELWQKFIRDNNINTELVRFSVLYMDRITGETRGYDVQQDVWF